MDTFLTYLPYLIPILILQLVLATVALLDLSRREHVWGPKWAWVPIIIVVNLLGPIIYLLFGRRDS